MSSIKATFTRNLRGYLNASRITGAFSSGRVQRTSKAMSADPIEPVDAVFSTLPENYEAPDHLAGFQSVTQQLLADGVLENLLHIQNEISSMSDEDFHEIESPNAKATRAYQHTLENFPKPAATIYSFTIESEGPLQVPSR